MWGGLGGNRARGALGYGEDGGLSSDVFEKNLRAGRTFQGGCPLSLSGESDTMEYKHRESLEFMTPDLSGEAVQLPLAGSGVSAGFPSPAEDYAEMSLDLNKELVRNPASTFFARVSGVSMIDEGIGDGDLLVIDRAAEVRDGVLAVCCIDGDFTLKRVRVDRGEGCLWLVPANPDYRPIRVSQEDDFRIWGVVRYVIKKF